MSDSRNDPITCDIIDGCHRPGLEGGAHKCRECGKMVHNLCLQEVSGVQDEMPFLCGLWLR